MNSDEQVESWLSANRAASPRKGFADRVMSSIEQAATQPAPTKRRLANKQRVLLSIPYLVWTAAAVVFAVRIYSLIYFVVTPTTEYSVVARDTIEEKTDDNRDASRS